MFGGEKACGACVRPVSGYSTLGWVIYDDDSRLQEAVKQRVAMLGNGREITK